ncbi:BPSL0067 family protein [Massilia sp. Root335]|jgi:hypothetical protein|uniref:BPSL0067 family protein n=1 Tax=Massilia sp. Root335 TaxID=1736517 RepID=UPI000AC2C778|nr:BPSL0067 family protein [Massilia sp. Root335]
MAVIGLDGKILSIPNKRFVYSNPQALVGMPLVGLGECVAMIQRYFPSIGNTRTWKAGQRVVESKDIKIGTVIGTMVDGKWPGLSHGNHVGIFGGVESRSIQTGFMTSFVIVEQFIHSNVKAIQARVLHAKGIGPNGRYSDPSNNASAFFIIEK